MTCPDCQGKGYVVVSYMGCEVRAYAPCERCNGKGKYASEETPRNKTTNNVSVRKSKRGAKVR